MAKNTATSLPIGYSANPNLLRDLPTSRWFQRLRSAAKRWFAKNKRTLPWRLDRDPYRVWVSEIMLQQTQVATVVDYFNRFMGKFPTIQKLASAREQSVLTLWEGLGYYRRARNLHAAAKKVVVDFDGHFPDTMDDVRSLPGIGRYSARAILSIAHDQRQPILEGNTFRLHARLLGLNSDPRSKDAEKFLWEFATNILPRDHAGDFNQALMEIGSEICKPKAPDCDRCPLQKLCAAYELGLQNELPVAGKKTAFQSRNEALVVIRSGDQVLARKNTTEEWWAGLWDFCRVETFTENDDLNRDPIQKHLESEFGLPFSLPKQPLKVIRHSVTKYRIRLACYEIIVDRPIRNSGRFRKVPRKRVHQLPLNVTARQFFSYLANQKCSQHSGLNR